ncbi:TPA: sugar porter family MFS transporter [Salmonella enterica subsp. salamae]|nr:sugar porter family MFS transporter [Salmonella enterica subsp. salamae]
MEIAVPSMSDKKWTCADLLSSYRFWGIIFFFFTLSFISSLSSSYSIYFWSKSLSIPADRISVILACGQIGYLLGMIASWFVCRIKSRYPLYFVALLLIIGVVCFFCVNNPSEVIRLIIGQFLMSFGVGIMTLLVPMLLFSAIGSTQTFVILFSLCLLFRFIIANYLPIFIYSIPHEYISTITITLSIIALLFLFPLPKELFSVAPPKRNSSTQRPECAKPVIVALLAFFIPVYIIYWFVRIHREMQFVTPSPRLMTACGAGWLSAIMPFSAAILCLTLSEEIRTLLANENEDTGIQSGWALFWALLFPPVGIAIIQAKMNRFIVANAENSSDES